MAKGRLGTIVRHIHRVAALRDNRERSDRELLETFAANRDQKAFAALLSRHGGMVLGVCRHVLHHEQDAEDAFQVTFLVLARSAGSIRKKESLANWLHGVAYRTAMSAKRAAARRRRREERTQPMTRGSLPCELGWREVQAALEEELEGLPATFRAAFVLCYLEGQSRSEAARELGLKVGTVASRVERARRQLQGRLARRGITLSAVLCAAALSRQAAAAVPARLAADTVNAAVCYAAGRGAGGAISATAARLLKGVTRAMFVTKCKVSGFIVLTSALALAASLRCHNALVAKPLGESRPALAGPPAGGGPQVPAPAEKPRSGARAGGAAESVRVRGRVLNPDGKPVAGAKLYLRYDSPKPLDSPVRATSGDDGRFEFTFARSELDTTYSDNPASQVAAVAPGYGFDVAPVGEGELTLRLVKDVPLSGRILDQEGKPIAGAKVRVTDVLAFKGDDLTEYLGDIRKGGMDIYPVKGWSGPLPGQPASVTTGADGKLRLTGVGRERVVRLVVEGPGIQYVRLEAMTRPGEPVVNPSPHRQQRIYGAAFEHLAAPSRPIRGVVRDKDTGKPVAGVGIGSFLTTHTTKTDKDGRYELLGCGKSNDYPVTASPPEGQRYLAANVRFADAPGLAAIHGNIDLVRGIPVRGRVTDQATGKPIRRARVEYHAVFPNAHAHEGLGSTSATTAPDGSYEVVALSGPGLLAVTDSAGHSKYMPALVTPKEMKEFYKGWTPGDQERAFSESHLLVAVGPRVARGLAQENYNALALIEPDANAGKLRRDIALRPALTLKGTVTGPDGKPLAGATVFGLGPNAFASTALKTAEFTVTGINPRRTRKLLFVHKDKGLGYHREVRGDDKGPLTIKLQPLGTASGRVVDKDGQPVAGLVLNAYRSSLMGPGGVQVKTDKDGRFRAAGLVPGQKYDLMPLDQRARLTEAARGIVVEPGKDKDLGDITAESGN